MRTPIRLLLALPSCWLLAGALTACSDDEPQPVTQTDTEETGPVTFSDELTAAGLAPGSYRVDNGGAAVCIRTYTYPGGGHSSVPVELSGFESFDLVVDGDLAFLRGTFDELGTRWADDCLEFDVSQDSVTNLQDCNDDDDPCTPFSLVRVCANNGEPTFYASVPECGQTPFPLVPPSE